jgi:hypothetical protein
MGVSVADGISVLVAVAVFIGRQDPLLPDDTSEGVERFEEHPLRQIGRKRERHL